MTYIAKGLQDRTDFDHAMTQRAIRDAMLCPQTRLSGWLSAESLVVVFVQSFRGCTVDSQSLEPTQTEAVVCDHGCRI
ncbi:MAG: hypothetical protein EBZ03_11295 [Betaproteobacteria bacterium]|nr:hypothetical protein [Betaproteobacteria bacterium]NBO44977.1 hypothetical protein [Betaproteobacteria bacterium]NBP11420.1 hypothetical protein [Betaproteobacteria bacterium]NBP62571.1 hypothetical protein [Betaproteobacteria bacterium]NBQ09556.1 hypothetical protein [Betaproteobacteria bacterium]